MTLKHETMGECFELRRSLSLSDLYDFTTALARETQSACEHGWVASEQAYHKEERRKNQKYVRRAENAGAAEESFAKYDDSAGGQRCRGGGERTWGAPRGLEATKNSE